MAFFPLSPLDLDCADLVLTPGRRDGFEHLCGYEMTSERRIGPRTDRKAAAILFPFALIADLNDAQNRVFLHHNHPSSQALSPTDLRQVLAFPGLAALFAHGHDGSSYVAKRGGNRLGERAIHEAEVAVAKAFGQAVGDGHLHRENAKAFYCHAIAILLMERPAINYEYRFSRVIDRKFRRVFGDDRGLIPLIG
ncbi:hypothetical protein SAMN06297251_10978 [Fulvimarina manganoxydans]|uniref:Uncharacterized protein n=1 Tax=Fulvimarina manganoxydans TaxID=937218 RepID=A0A1W2CBN9_9HYPH|nr:hypothetical protein [Fulvimarina manganoxydans]SMC82068.1 hypothetical protein SAMN06297251_10978 [Fulvimarina manganoxydans]